MAIVAGVDGCTGGWVVVAKKGNRFYIDHRRSLAAVSIFLTSISDDRASDVVMAVDMPIGLLSSKQEGGRLCDRKARENLGDRRNSVFSPLAACDLDKSPTEVHRNNSIENTYGEAWKLLRGMLGARSYMIDVKSVSQKPSIVECHPEVSFSKAKSKLKGEGDFEPCTHKKTSTKGRDEREDIFRSLYCKTDWIKQYECVKVELCEGRGTRHWMKKLVDVDDILDAAIACWTAERVWNWKQSNPRNNALVGMFADEGVTREAVLAEPLNYPAMWY